MRRQTQERKGEKSLPEPKDPIYLHKSRETPQVADPAAPGDADAHGFDDGKLLAKLLPRDHEHRGCKSKDVDLRIKRDNKAVSSGVCQHLESDGGAYDGFEDSE